MIELDVTLARQGFTLRAALSIAKGVTAVVGPSGVGKSTLLRVIAGLEPQAWGHLTIGDNTPLMGPDFHQPAEARPFGMVFQDNRLFPHLTVRSNLLFGATNADALDEVAALLGIQDLLERRPRALSGGEARRVALGRALLHAPDWLLLDEPLTGLDDAKRSEILGYLSAIFTSKQRSALLVSHSWNEVLGLADQLVVLDKGAVRHHGPIASVLTDPDFLMSIGANRAKSVLNGVVIEHHDDISAIATGEARLWTRLTHRTTIGTKQRLIIQAQDVALALTPPEHISTRSVVPVTIEALNHGLPGLVLCRIGDQTLLAEVSRSAIKALGLHIGMSLYALVKASSIAVEHTARNEI